MVRGHFRSFIMSVWNGQELSNCFLISSSFFLMSSFMALTSMLTDLNASAGQPWRGELRTEDVPTARQGEWIGGRRGLQTWTTRPWIPTCRRSSTKSGSSTAGRAAKGSVQAEPQEGRLPGSTRDTTQMSTSQQARWTGWTCRVRPPCSGRVRWVQAKGASLRGEDAHRQVEEHVQRLKEVRALGWGSGLPAEHNCWLKKIFLSAS